MYNNYAKWTHHLESKVDRQWNSFDVHAMNHNEYDENLLNIVEQISKSKNKFH
jgi:hypothetical protein